MMITISYTTAVNNATRVDEISICVIRESDKGGSSAASLWASRQITDHRSSGSAMTSYGGASDFKSLRRKFPSFVIS